MFVRVEAFKDESNLVNSEVVGASLNVDHIIFFAPYHEDERYCNILMNGGFDPFVIQESYDSFSRRLTPSN